MINNPYPTPKEEDKATCRFQTYLSAEDKGLLFGIRPIKGTPQAVVNHLIKNLCNDLRDLGIKEYRADADDIFATLIERRPLSDEQIDRLRRTSIGPTKQIPARLQQYRGGTEVRQGLANTQAGSNHPSFKVVRGKQPNRKDKAGKKKSTS